MRALSDITTNRAHAQAAIRANIVVRAFTLLAMALLLPRLLLFAQTTTAFVFWPWQFDYSEGVNLNATMQLAAGHNIYRHNGPDSFISAPYPPVFYLLNAPLTWLTGPSLTFGRILSLAATLIIACLLVYVIRRLTATWLPGLFAAVLWLSFSPVIIWAALYTQHILALMFSLGGIAVIVLNRTGRRIYLAALLFALAFYTKQSAIDAAGAAALALLLTDKRTGARFMVALGLIVGLPFLAANLLIRGGLWEHLFTNQPLDWKWSRFGRLFARFWGESWPVLSAGALCSAATALLVPPVLRKKWKITLSLPWILAVLYFVIALASVLVRLGREGVNYNHFIDALLPACLLAALALGYLSAWVGQQTQEGAPALEEGSLREKRSLLARPLGAPVTLSALLVVLAIQAFSFGDPHVWYAGPWPAPEIKKQMLAISDMIINLPGDMYSEDIYLAYANGRPVLYDDAFMFTHLAEQGKWDDSVFNERLRDRRFSLILLEYGPARFTLQARDLFEANYQVLYNDIRNSYIPVPAP